MANSEAKRAISFLRKLTIPEGRLAGRKMRIAGYQQEFIEGALADGIQYGILSVGRGNGKSAISGGLALAHLVGAMSKQPRRDVVIAARTKEQARIVWGFAQAFADSLPDDIRENLIIRRHPRLEIELRTEDGPHILRAVAADGRNLLGLAPTLVICDEMGHWPQDKGSDLMGALFSALGKRDGRALMISTSASDDAHFFSRLIDDPLPGSFVREYRAPMDLPIDSDEALLASNPGSPDGIGPRVEWLKSEAQRAMKQGGSALANFRLYNLNQRVVAENRDVLIAIDDWLAAETSDLPERAGPCFVGIDLGGSSSMTAAAFYWPETGRLETLGAFPGTPGLADRGRADAVGDRYIEMAERGELVTMGERVVPVGPFMARVANHVLGESVAALMCDRFRQAEFADAYNEAGLRAPVIYRGMGFKDGAADVEGFRRAVMDGKVQTAPSLLMRSALSDAVCLIDPANNAKLAKARSRGRIDAAAAAVLAVAEGQRQFSKPKTPTRIPKWA